MKIVLFILALILLSATVVIADDNIVIMNIQRYIYHNPDCMWAKKCTRNCVKTTKSEAISKGARPCQVCGG